jgi:hypothetical protein
MIMALTDQRLMIWAAGRRWRAGQFLGYVSRDRILQVTAPTTGSGWRTVVVHLANEPAVPVLVPAITADGLVAALSGPAGREPGDPAARRRC